MRKEKVNPVRERSRLLYAELRQRAITLFGRRVDFPKMQDVIIEPEAIWFMETHLYLFLLAAKKGDHGTAYRLKYREWIKSMNGSLPLSIWYRLEDDLKRRGIHVSQRPWADPATYFAKLRRWWAHPESTPKWAIRSIEARQLEQRRKDTAQ